jgi:hypothetical protein
MVERPIKKSERQSQGSTDKNSENTDSTAPIESNPKSSNPIKSNPKSSNPIESNPKSSNPIESNPKSSKPSRNRSSDTGKKASFGNENRQQGNPALARGPKPVKPPVKVQTEELETESEFISEESQE